MLINLRSPNLTRTWKRTLIRLRFLIVESPINPVYMRCHNKSLTKINFKLTDQSNNLIDLQEEELVVTLFVKS